MSSSTVPQGRPPRRCLMKSDDTACDGAAALFRLLKPAEAARFLAISPRKLLELTNPGGILCVRIGRAVRYDLDDLRAWIQKQKGPRR